MPNLRKIKDPVYGYVYYSALEEKIISHRLVLRLHYIRQNGAAYLTYPSMRVHRFEHSMGAMHVAGSLFKHAMEVSDDEVDRTIVSAIEAASGDTVSAIRSRLSADDPGLALLKDDGFYTYNCLQNVDDLKTFARLLLFQSVRIAALVHDIGHPPFSHTFETALKQSASDKPGKRKIDYPSHEQVGLQLLGLIVEDIKATETGALYHFAQCVLKMVDAIISSKSPHAWRMQGLSALISGDIDSDRLDYVRRDTLSAGSNTTAYDLGRLIDSVKLKGVRSRQGSYLRLVITADALSTIEAFFSVRFHLYRWMLWHHNVIRQNLALILSVKLIAKLRDSQIAEVKVRAEDFIQLATDPARRSDYWRFTDYYFLDRLVTMLGLLGEHRRQIPKGAQGEPYALLERYLHTFLFREKRHLKPLWKRPDDYVRFARIVVGDGAKRSQSKAVRLLNMRVREAYLTLVRSLAGGVGIDTRDARAVAAYERQNVEFLSGTFATRLEKFVSKELVSHGARIRAYYLAKFRPAPENMKLHDREDDDNDGIDLKVLSPSVAALTDAWEALPQLWLLVENLPSVDISTSAKDNRPRKEFYSPVGLSLARFLQFTIRGETP